MTRSDRDDRDGDRQWSQSEKQQILNDARATLARCDDQEIPRRDGNQKTWSAAEKAEVLRTARDILRRDATTGMITKVTYNAPAARQADAASEARQPRQRRQWRRRAEASADDAYFDPIESIGWPEPSEQDNLDTRFEDLIADRVEKLFAGQHQYVLAVMAQALADSVERDGVTGQALERERRQHRRDVRKLQAQIENLQHALGELRDVVALERSRTISLRPLPARRDLN
jgi:hypothetical protein